MEPQWMDLTLENIDDEHLCCAISEDKHRDGVHAKRAWLKERFGEGHVFRKLAVRGKVFIEYAPLEWAWTPVTGENYLYIYCLWVSGSYKGKGYGKALLDSCVADAQRQGKAGVCILSADKKKPFLADRKFLERQGFETVDRLGDGFRLMARSWDGRQPRFTEPARSLSIAEKELTIYYSPQCPYSADCIEQIGTYCTARQIPHHRIAVDSLEKAKQTPGIFNNWAVFREGQFQTVHLLDEGYLKKMLA